MFIHGEIPDALLERIKNHPTRGNRTQAEFYEYMFETHLDRPESRLAVLEQNQRNLRLELNVLKDRLAEAESRENLDAQIQQLAATEVDTPSEAPPAAPGATPSAVAPYTNGCQDLEGNFVAVLEEGDTFDTPSMSFVVFTFRLDDGRTFKDRLIDFPLTRRTEACKRVFGLRDDDSFAKKLPEITGRRVQVRRTKNQAPDGPPIMTYYHSLPSSAAM